ncbi:MAG TPA: type II toxin-antitoxin system VapC family toxin [Patescibacteria group bacterium]|nr:type II toxin-antitoxin system VapC family toxin [Patescibacteria group bacterium]
MALTVIDAGVVIAMLDATDAHHSESRAALREALDQGDDLVLPASAYAECLVGPLRRGPEAAATVDAFIEALPARVEPVTPSIARAAAALRARHGRAVRLPDALVLATAIELRAHRLLTTDAGWPALDVPAQVIGRDSS